MTNSVQANGAALRQRLTEANISERELRRRTGLSARSVRSILFRDSLSGAMTIVDVNRCLEEVGMPWGDLLDPQGDATAGDTPDSDVATLGALLNGAGRATRADRLCRALAWEPGRLTRTGNLLDERLRSLGMRLVQNGNGYAIRPVDLRTHDALRRLNETRDDEDGMGGGMARFLYQAYAGTLSPGRTKHNHALQIAALLNRGAIQVSEGVGERYVLTDEVKYALDF